MVTGANSVKVLQTCDLDWNKKCTEDEDAETDYEYYVSIREIFRLESSQTP